MRRLQLHRRCSCCMLRRAQCRVTTMSHSGSVSLADVTPRGEVKREEGSEGGTESSGNRTYMIESSIPHPNPSAQDATSRHKNGQPGEAHGQPITLPPIPIDLPLSAPHRLCQNHTPSPHRCLGTVDGLSANRRANRARTPWSIHGSRVGEKL